MNKIFFALIIFFISTTAFCQVEGDRIIAVIGNDIITESDLQYQVQAYARQNQITEISPYLAQQIFQSMVTNKMILAKAEQDSVTITEDELNKELDSRLKSLIEQVGSEERLEQAYGMSLLKIKILMKDDLSKNMKIDRMKRKKFMGGMKATDKEIKDFFNAYRDSLPEVNEEFEIAHIYLERKVSNAEKEEAKRIAGLILDSIKEGSDFSELARRNSDDSMSAIAGGDLGYAKKGTFVKEYEETVFSLSPGEVSGIVETQFGYHIIKLNEKLGDKVKSQHILITFPKFESSDFETINFLKELKLKIETGLITFDSAAIKYSQDEMTKSKGGYVGKIPADQLDSITAEALKNLSAGQITDPLRIGNDKNYGYELYKLINVFPPHKLTLEGDYDKIKRFAESYKENKEIEKWINEIRETIYVDVKM